jgi:hypothetical protein
VFRWEPLRGAGRKADFAGRRGHHLVHPDHHSDAGNKDDLAPLVRLAADAWADRDAGQSGGRPKEEDHDCRWASGRDSLWEADRDYPLVKDVAAARRAGREQRPRAFEHRAGRGAVDPEPVDAAERANHWEHSEQLAAMAVHVERALASVPQAFASAEQGQRAASLRPEWVAPVLQQRVEPRARQALARLEPRRERVPRVRAPAEAQRPALRAQPALPQQELKPERGAARLRERQAQQPAARQVSGAPLWWRRP